MSAVPAVEVLKIRHDRHAAQLVVRVRQRRQRHVVQGPRVLLPEPAAKKQNHSCATQKPSTVITGLTPAIHTRSVIQRIT